MTNNSAVILLNWNGYTDTVVCVESLIANDPQWKIYIVDNASANNEAQKLQLKFPQVAVLSQNENLGFCEGNNVGIRHALADGANYIAILNNDTIVSEMSLTKLLADYISLPEAGAISPVILQYPETNNVWFVKAEWQPARLQFSMNPDNESFEKIKGRKPWESYFANGCCLLTSAKVLNDVGLMDQRYFAYYDEADWCNRMKKKGYKSYVTAATYIYHVKHHSNYNKVSLYLLTRNRLLWMKENLLLSERRNAFPYLFKEFNWHLLNVLGFVKGEYTRDLSRAYLYGWLDFKLKRFGRWNKKRQIFFEKN